MQTDIERGPPDGMLFLRKESFREYVRRYPVTTLLLAIQIALYIATEVYGSSKDELTLEHFGALFRDGGSAPEWWRYIAPIFLHSGIEHLLFNSFALLVFAPPLERLFGPLRYAAFYLLTGIIGNIATDLFHSEPYMAIGASGAIFGVYGAYIYIGLFKPEVLDIQSRKTMYTIVIIGIVFTFISRQVNVSAHLGGFVAGVALAAVMSLLPLRRFD
ncbi:rhomboid family intramembrane serine protease [Paenibacillus cymbidii]|uniref:rhomboid family intramembrane serine protease n=1 Tax=Paenibacillus cymbidii TaxID=1639034 RepID=UPI001F22BF61|nr:rhomboid family intramembrane serine protease [Paenibacillus cymbidii]